MALKGMEPAPNPQRREGSKKLHVTGMHNSVPNGHSRIGNKQVRQTAKTWHFQEQQRKDIKRNISSKTGKNVVQLTRR